MSNHINIFEDVLYALRQFVESDKALNTKEIGYRLNVSHRTAQRISKSLHESGWLDCKEINRNRLYLPADKAKQLFGVNA